MDPMTMLTVASLGKGLLGGLFGGGGGSGPGKYYQGTNVPYGSMQQQPQSPLIMPQPGGRQLGGAGSGDPAAALAQVIAALQMQQQQQQGGGFTGHQMGPQGNQGGDSMGLLTKLLSFLPGVGTQGNDGYTQIGPAAWQQSPDQWSQIFSRMGSL